MKPDAPNLRGMKPVHWSFMCQISSVCNLLSPSFIGHVCARSQLSVICHLITNYHCSCMCQFSSVCYLSSIHDISLVMWRYCPEATNFSLQLTLLLLSLIYIGSSEFSFGERSTTGISRPGMRHTVRQ